MIRSTTLSDLKWRNPNKIRLDDKTQNLGGGFEPTGEANKGQFRIHFFIIAILFIIFDVETLFLFLWAVILSDKSISMFVLVEIIIFIAILAVGLVYAWTKGALEWVE